jgi:hypothetical protein
MTNERACIHVPNYRNFVPLQICLRSFFRAPVRRETGKLAHNQPFNIRTRSFFVVRVRANISDVRVGEADNLSGITRIGENFLISGEAGVENGFPATAGFCTRGASYKNSPVFQRKRGGLSNLMVQCNLLKAVI